MNAASAERPRRASLDRRWPLILRRLLASRLRHAARRRRDQDRDGALPARGQRLRRHRRADPRRQRRQGDRGDPRGQLGAGRDGVRRRRTTCPPTPRPSSSRRPWSPTGSSSSPRRTTEGRRGHGQTAPTSRCRTPASRSSSTASTPASRTSPTRSGPNGVNKDGTLDHTLAAARNAFEGNGALGNEMIRNLSEAAVTFGAGQRRPVRDGQLAGQVHRGAGRERRRRPGVHEGPGRGRRRRWPTSARS